MESGTDTVRSDTTCNRPYSKRTLSAEHYTGYHSAESDMDLSPTEDGKELSKTVGPSALYRFRCYVKSSTHYHTIYSFLVVTVC